ncbi:uncharacterized protein A1O5_04303 [Cladophialophora psammophila CBS 110553]|uniref:Uncharacterized protein n=1 Tax=Cladophialophora psammophila CBS 110553 TaxID=1182543 RepID=W9WYV8_9EURO|nr:uncharacterized protein A1O5_04303 [Cladophialophora psammophila CBS 110553]EXJ73153.1 hypothetical protein A1O5_04303 [Cladophialophora psammophila CBS 110553]
MSADLYAAFLADKAPSLEETGNTPTYATTIAPSTTAIDIQLPTPVQPTLQQKAPSPLWQRDTGVSHVLFDTEDADFEDEFGDFETARDSTNNGINIRQHDLVAQAGLISTNISDRAPLVPDLPDADNMLCEPSHRGIKLSQTSTVQNNQSGTRDAAIGAQPSWDDDWGDFEQTEPAGALQLAVEATTHASDDEWEPLDDCIPASNQQISHPNILASTESKAMSVAFQPDTQTSAFERPTNVPPPSSLLQLLSSVFDFIHKSNADHTFSKSELASKVLLVFRVSGRIASGRTLRWKRDALLAQSVRIGQSGKSGGMKLTAVNKSEATKEERDTEEMVRDWSSYVHEFNSILAQAQVTPHRMRLSSTPSLKKLEHTDPSDPSKQCVLCGLKRTERLSDIDVDVDDLFGEFWVEHWGHKDCFNFWYSYKNMLGHR